MTHKEAKKSANKKSPNITFTGDAGNGCKFEVYFCPVRSRQIWTTISKDGVKIL